uniref:Uncharacterized protein n=1 Tax=Ciona savignyi TaxID=51511 RepID=H2ZD53_CIOSA
MELHGRQTLGSDSEYHGADVHEVSQKAPDSSLTHEGGSGYKRQMSGSDDDKRSSRDRMPGDGFGGYTRGPHPSSGQQSGGRTLPPRFAQQRQQQQQQAWNRNEAWSQPPARHSIMKRERSENDDMDGHSTGY